MWTVHGLDTLHVENVHVMREHDVTRFREKRGCPLCLVPDVWSLGRVQYPGHILVRAAQFHPAKLAEREGIGEAVLLREALNELLRKYNA